MLSSLFNLASVEEGVAACCWLLDWPADSSGTFCCGFLDKGLIPEAIMISTSLLKGSVVTGFQTVLDDCECVGGPA